jgi:hypothetical protein
MNAQTNVPTWSTRIRVATMAIAVALVGAGAIALLPAPTAGNVDYAGVPPSAQAQVDTYADTILEVEMTRPARGFASNSYRHGYFEFENDPVDEIAD